MRTLVAELGLGPLGALVGCLQRCRIARVEDVGIAPDLEPGLLALERLRKLMQPHQAERAHALGLLHRVPEVSDHPSTVLAVQARVAPSRLQLAARELPDGLLADTNRHARIVTRPLPHRAGIARPTEDCLAPVTVTTARSAARLPLETTGAAWPPGGPSAATPTAVRRPPSTGCGARHGREATSGGRCFRMSAGSSCGCARKGNLRRTGLWAGGGRQPS